MVAEGLPAARRQYDFHHDIIAGNDFLSLFADSPEVRDYADTTLSSSSTLASTTPTTVTTTSAEISAKAIPVVSETNTLQVQSDSSSEPKSRKAMKISIKVSSSVEGSVEKIHTRRTTEMPTTDTESPTTTTVSDVTDTSIVSSEEYPSLVADVNKSEFVVDEGEPITSNHDLFDEFSSPARVQELPNPTGFRSQHVVYHNGPKEDISSVSYSTVIQGLPSEDEQQEEIKTWGDEGHKDRQERHYIAKETANQFESATEKVEMQKKWQNDEPAEKNWGVAEKNYAKVEKLYGPITISPLLPKVYGHPEQNYEVDEAVSVMTNGRTHGVQPIRIQSSTPASGGKKTDNQKVGYVLEGRNYRKYRVEERTSDGFIVGEYGVVSHNDGSLRGVRYTADGTINPRLIYDALMKFLSL